MEQIPLWKHRSFLALWSGEAVSTIGASLGTMANSWLLYEQTGSASAVGNLWLIYLLPSLLVQLAAGPLLDRWNRGRVLVTVQWIRGTIYAIPLLMLWWRHLSPWHLYLVSLINGLVQPLYVPASLALSASLFSDRQLTRANGYLDGTSRLLLAVTPPLGGLLVAGVGAQTTLAVVCLAYLASGGLLFLLARTIASDVDRRESWFRQLLAGYRYVFRQRVLLWLSVFVAFVQFGVGVTTVLTLPYVKDELDGDSLAYGLFEAGYPLGYFLGAMLVGWKTPSTVRRGVMLGALAFGGATFLALGMVHHLWLALLIELAAGISAPFFHVTSTSLFQRVVPPYLLGQVFSIRLLIVRGIMPLGVAVGSRLGDIVGVRPMFAAVGALILLVSMSGAVLPYFRFLNTFREE